MSFITRIIARATAERLAEECVISIQGRCALAHALAPATHRTPPVTQFEIDTALAGLTDEPERLTRVTKCA
jgi:hypothetical protein